MSGDRKIKKSGKEYVYYRCTKHKTKCTQLQVSEKMVDEQILTLLKDITLPQDTVDYITLALKGSLDVKRSTSDKERKRLQDLKDKLMTRLDRLYEDKLDGNITDDFYNRKFEEYSKRVEDLTGRISKYTKADIDYYRYGSGILQLAHKASKLYRMATDLEKRELLGYLLSNCQLLDRELIVTYRKPFDIIMKHKQSLRTQENSSTKAKNTLSGALPSIERERWDFIRTFFVQVDNALLPVGSIRVQ